MRLIHHVSKNLILNQGCSQKCHNNENIHVDSNNQLITLFVFPKNCSDQISKFNIMTLYI